MAAQRKELKTGQGFTLIEIVLVIALAGLILIVVFLAVSTTQRNRRDFVRKNDLARLQAAIITYSTNTRGVLPADQAEIDTVESTYLNSPLDPLTGQRYPVEYRGLGTAHDVPDVGRGPGVPPPGTIYFQIAHWCNTGPDSHADAPTDPIAGNDLSVKNFVVWVGLEQGGYYCLDNY